MEVFVMTAWLIWMRRNKLRSKEATQPCTRIAQLASSMLAEFQQGKQRRVAGVQAGLVRWQPPAENSIKANFDGAVFGEEQEVGIGVVLRDCEGQVLAALSEKVRLPATVEVLEMMAARRAALFARELGFSRVCFEGDAELVVKCLQSGLVSNALTGHLVKDFMSIRGYFQSSSIIHVRRQGNHVAHALARDARFSFPLRVWMEEVPPNVFSFVVKDLQ
ncbi:uncharacterized protein LOC115968042 [Quercus lobata]|uniref:uncharacterized protein LOC115968042 n=1 Tax=Quercus lobata TaxID=97700 RepID=UPI0012489B20|nr:uncharacterized protein LOC115968042 [Quercus lobata]